MNMDIIYFQTFKIWWVFRESQEEIFALKALSDICFFLVICLAYVSPRKLEIICSSETSMNFYWTVRPYVTVYSILLSYSSSNRQYCTLHCCSPSYICLIPNIYFAKPAYSVHRIVNIYSLHCKRTYSLVWGSDLLWERHDPKKCQTTPQSVARPTNSDQVKSSYFTTDGQSVGMSWCRAQSGTSDQRYIFFLKLQTCLIWGALSDERSGLSLVSLLSL
jgi:hypothetical protein